MVTRSSIDHGLRNAVGIDTPFAVENRQFVEGGLDGVIYVRIAAVATLVPNDPNYHADLLALGIDSEKFSK